MSKDNYIIRYYSNHIEKSTNTRPTFFVLLKIAWILKCRASNKKYVL